VVAGASPVRVIECDVTGEGFSAENDPYVLLVPYSTCELEGSSVVQSIVAEVAVTAVELTLLITGPAAPPALAERSSTATAAHGAGAETDEQVTELASAAVLSDSTVST